MKIEVYDKLPTYAVDIRMQVFVKEQGFSKELELDEFEKTATHLVGFSNGESAATARYFFDKRREEYLISRIAVRKEHRGKGFGAEIVTAAEKEIIAKGGKSAIIHAQLRAKGFYESIGYNTYGDIDLEEGVEHIMMRKCLI
ncbi:MAG: GNAT family N-acetyltransferase [Ruminococcus sp.]|nr:GNAT family N-acetyltransferase [Ruminococcus sp.]